VLVAALAAPVQAAPRDEALRLAPPDAAIVFVVQDARTHVRNLVKSPFVEWLPRSELFRSLPQGVNLAQIRESLSPLFGTLGVTPEELLDDVFGDAVVFAYTPPTSPKGERAVLLVRPRKPETLTRLLDRLNEIQTDNGEIKEVIRREHGGQPYFERQKSNGQSEFYCTRGGVFAYSGSEADIQATIDRDVKLPPVGEKLPELSSRLGKLGVADAIAAVLVNPRSLDAEVKAKVATASADEKPFLDRFAEVWAALDSAAVYLSLDTNLEIGLSLDFRPDDLPHAAKQWLTGPRTPSRLWSAIPDDALFAAAARFRAGELIATVQSLLPEKGKKELDRALGDTLGSVFGRDRLAQVLDALGPDWAVWAEPPTVEGNFLPVLAVAVRIDPTEPDARTTRRAIERAVAFGFQAAQVAYNASHPDQIETVESQDGDVVITSLVSEKLFPPGVRPSYAFKGGYLVLASTPDAIKRFRAPTGEPMPGEVVAARFSGEAARAYLKSHGSKLAAFLASKGAGEEGKLQKHIDQLAAVLELVDRIELVTRGSDTGLRLALRAKLVKPLK
jgi:hypothetical protein